MTNRALLSLLVGDHDGDPMMVRDCAPDNMLVFNRLDMTHEFSRNDRVGADVGTRSRNALRSASRNCNARAKAN
jgi:hypothetical protein